MALTFEDFKTELISNYRKNEFDQFLHLLIKSQNWNELLTLLKKEPLKYIIYGLRKNIISEEFLLEIPQSERENNNIYNSKVKLENCSDTVLLFGSSELTLTQGVQNRCKIVLIGNAKLNATASDTSMIEVDANETSSVEITANNNSFIFINTNDNSTANLNTNDNATTKLTANGKTDVTVNLYDTSFLNATLYWFSNLNLKGKEGNYTIKKKDLATITTNTTKDES